MSAVGDDRRLACGTPLGVLVDEVVDGADPARRDHEAVCVHCQAALVDLERLWDQVRQLAAEDVELPDQLTARVIATIRRQGAGPGRAALVLDDVVPALVRHVLVHEERGATRIADSVVSEVAARAARAVPGVHALGQMSPVRAVVRRSGSGAVAVEIRGPRVALRLRLVIDGARARSVAEVTAAVRAAVIAQVERLTGLEVVTVDVAVDDLRLVRD